MESRNWWSARRLVSLAVLFLPCCWAQTNVLSVGPLEKVTAKHGATLEVKTPVLLKQGYHVNSDKPSESYLIPLRLTWEPGPLRLVCEPVRAALHLSKRCLGRRGCR